MIKLLNGHSLTVRDRFRAEKFALNLSERQSTATITIGPEAPEIKPGDWIQDEDEPGAGIVWHVKSVETAYESETRTLNCEHLIATLRNQIMFGEIKPGTMAGNYAASVCTAQQAARYVLNQQSDWTLGSFGFTKSAPYNFNSDDLLEALETISSSLLQAWWSYDFSRHPFRLNITQPGNEICEMRMSRNIQTLKMSVDMSRMYTRYYPIGKNNLHLSGGGYVSKNENLYGIICRTETDNDLDTQDKLRARAEERLNNHAEPLVTVTISGQDYSEATGESLDRIVLGRMCNIPLPGYGTVISERIIKISWGDKVRDKNSMTVTLANQVEDVASIVNKLNKSVKKGKKSHAKQGEADHAWMVDTNDHIGLVADAVAGEGASKDWSRVASVMVDGQGLHQKVTKAQGDIVTQQAQIDVNENRILQEVTDRTQQGRELSGRITVEAGRITQEVTDRRNADTTLDGKITVEAGKITQIVSAVGKDGQVTAASIVLSINQSSGESEAKIDAQKVYIGNEKSTTVIAGKCELSDVTANYIAGKIATIPVLNTRSLSATGTISCTGYVYGDNFVLGSSTGGQSNKYVTNAITELQIVDNGNNTYTLQKKDFGDSSWVDIGTFEHAASTGTTLSGSWSGNTLTVTATPQNEHFYQAITTGAWQNQDGTPYVSGNTFYVPVLAYKPGVTPPVYTLVDRAYVDATDIYNAGKNSVTVTAIDLASNYNPLGDTGVRQNIYIEADASNGTKKDDALFTLSNPTTYNSGNNRCINLNRNGNVIGRVNIDSVYTAGRNSVTVTAIDLASNYNPLGDTEVRQNIYIEADASNGTKKDDALFTLSNPTTYNSGNNRCINLNRNGNVIGRVNIDSVYSAGYNSGHIAGYNSGYSEGHNGVDGTDIILSKDRGNGPGTEMQSVPSSQITKANGKFSGYIWLKESDARSYKNLRSFEFTLPAAADWIFQRNGNQLLCYCKVAGKQYSATYTIT